jgi:3-deoxy-manno-octulosonate cytidylyltransferase (CMP-KDO synthetase)
MGNNDTIIVIPARLASTRFPKKILALIDGKPMILHVLERVKALNIGKCYIACCEKEVKTLIEEQGEEAILTDPDLPSGTDRVYAAMQQLGQIPEIVVGVQGDMPYFSGNIIKDTLKVIKEDKEIEIATPVIRQKVEILNNPNKVKAVFENMERNSHGKAIYFSRSTIPNGADVYYYHVGIYIYRREALSRIVRMKQSYLEKTERLEQLRWLENNIRIEAVPVVGEVASVDVEEDIEAALEIMKMHRTQ